MKEFIKKYYIQLIIIVLLLASIIFLFMQSRHIMVMIGEKSIELKKIQLDRVIAADFLQDVHIFKKNSEYINENISIFDVLLPNADDEKVQLFSDIERIAKETGNGTVTLTVNNATSKKDAKKKDSEEKSEPALSIKVTLVGSYNDLITFVKKIENMQYFSRITSFDIVKAESRSFSVAGEDVDFESAEKRADLLTTNMNINFYLK